MSKKITRKANTLVSQINKNIPKAPISKTAQEKKAEAQKKRKEQKVVTAGDRTKKEFIAKIDKEYNINSSALIEQGRQIKEKINGLYDHADALGMSDDAAEKMVVNTITKDEQEILGFATDIGKQMNKAITYGKEAKKNTQIKKEKKKALEQKVTDGKATPLEEIAMHLGTAEEFAVKYPKIAHHVEGKVMDVLNNPKETLETLSKGTVPTLGYLLTPKKLNPQQKDATHPKNRSKLNEVFKNFRKPKDKELKRQDTSETDKTESTTSSFDDPVEIKNKPITNGDS